jgi:hypothetical protein
MRKNTSELHFFLDFPEKCAIICNRKRKESFSCVTLKIVMKDSSKIANPGKSGLRKILVLQPIRL